MHAHPSGHMFVSIWHGFWTLNFSPLWISTSNFTYGYGYLLQEVALCMPVSGLGLINCQLDTKDKILMKGKLENFNEIKKLFL